MARSRQPAVRRRTSEGEPDPAVAPAPRPTPSEPPAHAPSPAAVRGDAVGRPRPALRDDDTGARRTASPAAPASGPTGLGALEALLDGGSDAFDMGDILRGGARLRPPEVGTRMSVAVLRVSRDELILDLPGPFEGWMARRERPDAAVGDRFDAFVLASDVQGVHLSTTLSGEAAGAFLQEALDAGVPVEGRFVARQGPGFTVRLGDVRAFCPISHASRLPLADPDVLVGTTASFLVLETGERTMVSRRALEEAEVAARRAAALRSLREGNAIDAIVTSVQPWGAFLDHDGVDLRLPKREVDWDEPADLTTRLERGQRLRVRVIGIEGDVNGDARVTVSSRDPDLDPWRTVAPGLSPGRVVAGRVVSVTDFGVFVRLDGGLDGLMHRSRLGTRLPSVGDTVEVRVLGVDTAARRIELQPADAAPPEPDETAEVRAALHTQDAGSMGTFGDLFSRLRR